jgi:pyruvate formate lyase activating enzyme
MTDLPPTPPETLQRARRIALAAGLHHVYTGNVHDPEGGTTFCSGCQRPLIERDWYRISSYALNAQGQCPHCGTSAAGRFGEFNKPFGRRRIPVHIA